MIQVPDRRPTGHAGADGAARSAPPGDGTPEVPGVPP